MNKLLGLFMTAALVVFVLCSCGMDDSTTGTDKNGNITDDGKNNSVTEDMDKAKNDIEDGIRDTGDAMDDALTDEGRMGRNYNNR